MRLEQMTVEVRELLPAPPAVVSALLTDVERMAGLGPEHERATWDVPNQVVEGHPEREQELVSRRAAELERNMREVLRAAAGLLP